MPFPAGSTLKPPPYGMLRNTANPPKLVPFVDGWTGQRLKNAVDGSEYNVWAPVIGTRFSARNQDFTTDVDQQTVSGGFYARYTPDSQFGYGQAGFVPRRPRQLVVGVSGVIVGGSVSYPTIAETVYIDPDSGEPVFGSLPSLVEYSPYADDIATAIRDALWPTIPDVEIVVRCNSAGAFSNEVVGKLSSWVVQDDTWTFQQDSTTHAAPAGWFQGGEILALSFDGDGWPANAPPYYEGGGAPGSFGSVLQYVPPTGGFGIAIGYPFGEAFPYSAGAKRISPGGALAWRTSAEGPYTDAPDTGSPAYTYRNYPRATFNNYNYLPDTTTGANDYLTTAALYVKEAEAALYKAAWNNQYADYERFAGYAYGQSAPFSNGFYEYETNFWSLSELATIAYGGHSGWTWGGQVNYLSDAAIAAHAVSMALDFFG